MAQIRQETPNDYSTVYETIKIAFENAEHSDRDEHNLVDRLRKSDAFIPQLSLVAELDNTIVGHILFTKIQIGDTIQLALAPVSVIPSMQNQGIGSKLIKKGHQIAKELGYEFSVVLGHANYYPRFGYLTASTFRIKAPFDVPDENFMALNLQGNNVELEGVVKYASEFQI